MNNRASSWLTIVITAAVGILFIIWHARLDLLSWIVVAMGILLILPGAYNIITSFTKSAPTADGSTSRAVERRGSAVSSTIASVCTVALGIWMLIQPDFFVELLAYLFRGAADCLRHLPDSGGGLFQPSIRHAVVFLHSSGHTGGHRRGDTMHLGPHHEFGSGAAHRHTSLALGHKLGSREHDALSCQNARPNRRLM